MKKALQIVAIVFLMASIAKGQYKTENPATYQEICYYSINKNKFVHYEKIKKEILAQNYKVVFSLLKEMATSLKNFELAGQNRAFEIWYIGNYTDFEQQVITAQNSTLAFLEIYEKRLRNKEALYYDHRMFLEQYLAYTAEHFYPEFWFMSMERYFSKKTVDRIKSMNKEGSKLFENSEFFRPYDIFNDLAKTEESEIKDYLDMDEFILDTTTFIPYSYVSLDRPIANYILESFLLDNATQDIDTDRQVYALKKMIEAVQKGEALLIGRLNLIELRSLRNKKKKETELSKK